MENFDLKDLWNKCKKNIKIDESVIHSFDLMTENSRLSSLEDGKAIVVVESEFVKTVIESEFYRQIQDSINLNLNSNFKLIILTEKEWKENETSKKDKKENLQKLESKTIHNDSLNQNYTFENFVVSSDNKTLYSAAMSVSVVGGSKWNPLFIYGGSGLGKTHILHAIGNHLWKKDPNKRIRYIEAREFSKIIHDAKQETNIYEGFSNIQLEFEKYDLLLVDDIQFISTQTKTKEVFFNIFNYFINQKKQVVITSDQYVEEIGGFEERLITRFKSGLLLPINPPDIETAKKIMINKLKQNNFNLEYLPPESLEYIAWNFSSNIRNLEGAINRIIFENIQLGERVLSLELISTLFKDISKNNRGLSPKRIIGEVAKYYGINSTAITGNTRKSNIMIARHISIYLIKTMTNLSLKEIGREFNRDHSTIISSFSKISTEKEKDNSLNQTINKIRKNLS